MSKAASGEALASAGPAMLKQASAERRMEFVQAVINRGLALYRGGQLDSADVLFETVDSEPAVRPRVLHIRGVIALQRGEEERALEFLEEAIRLDPTDGEAHANLGVLLLKHRQHPQALAAYASALTLQPDNVAALFGLAQALTKLDLIEFADDAYRDLLARAPEWIEPVVDFAALLNDSGRHDEAIALLREALARHPEHADLHSMLFACLFARGDWREAWPDYEWRLEDPEVNRYLLPTDRPRWQGEDLAGKTILLQSEQGYGDALQFVRYAPMVKARGGRVILRAHKALLPLMRTVAGVDDVVHPESAASASDVPFDVHVPLMSLPLIFGTQAGTVPAAVPYITPDPDLVAQWRERLGAQPGMSVGLAWQGNPAHPHDWRRSIPLDCLRSLLDCPGVSFVSLQVGPGRERLTELDDRIVDPNADIDSGSFADTAAIVANLDLVISIDSAIAHLAGAIGKPVWILLARSADWRWQGGREDSPWYPQALLFRQHKLGDWADVVSRLQAELSSFAGAGVPSPATGMADPLMATASKTSTPTRGSDPVICDALFVEASRHHRLGHFDRSKALFEHVLSLDPGHVNTLCNLGALELGLGYGPRALALLQTAVVLAPDLAPARIALADALRDAQKNEQALAQYQRAVELAPTDDAVHAKYALALCEFGDLDGAMIHFLAATKINQRQSSEFYEALGRACAARGNLQGAEISLQHALALDPQCVTAHRALGDLYLVLERPADAEASFRRALAVDQINPAALRGIEHAPAPDDCAAIAETA